MGGNGLTHTTLRIFFLHILPLLVDNVITAKCQSYDRWFKLWYDATLLRNTCDVSIWNNTNKNDKNKHCLKMRLRFQVTWDATVVISDDRRHSWTLAPATIPARVLPVPRQEGEPELVTTQLPQLITAVAWKLRGVTFCFYASSRYLPLDFYCNFNPVTCLFDQKAIKPQQAATGSSFRGSIHVTFSQHYFFILLMWWTESFVKPS